MHLVRVTYELTLSLHWVVHNFSAVQSQVDNLYCFPSYFYIWFWQLRGVWHRLHGLLLTPFIAFLPYPHVLLTFHMVSLVAASRTKISHTASRMELQFSEKSTSRKELHCGNVEQKMSSCHSSLHSLGLKVTALLCNI